MSERWLAVVGTREVDETTRHDIEWYVKRKISDGYGIVSGGATGVDHEAAQLAYDVGLTAEQFRIYLPVRLEQYCRALLERGEQGKCNAIDARRTTTLLGNIAVNRPGVIYDQTPFTIVNAESFHARNRQIVELATELVAYRVNHSTGTSYTINAAEQKQIPVKVFDYTIEQ